MSFINYATREIQLKIVYYGCGLCGKTTNLQVIHELLGEDSKGKLTSLATSQDRTLFFDFMPLVAEAISGFKTRFQMYTVPGQVMYNLTRRLVLKGADGIVFVADSQWDKMAENVESFNNLMENLSLQGDSIDSIPYVLQYNKQDMPTAAPVNYLEFLLNNRGMRHPSLPSSAKTGEGVLDTLNLVARLVLNNFIKTQTGRAAPQAEANVKLM